MRPLLVINPLDDAGFVRACEDLLDQAPPDPEELQALLRRSYPHTVVRPRALSGETLDVWYVYRDGHWVSSP
ncbi:MAG: hypothetical protein U0667_05360 [Chloroflexota bacterium]